MGNFTAEDARKLFVNPLYESIIAGITQTAVRSKSYTHHVSGAYAACLNEAVSRLRNDDFAVGVTAGNDEYPQELNISW